MKISQREARRLRKRVEELERVIDRQRSVWAQEFVGGAKIAAAVWEPGDLVPVAVRVARKLHHAVVAVGDETGTIRFIALPLREP